MTLVGYTEFLREAIVGLREWGVTILKVSDGPNGSRDIEIAEWLA